jgi:hypothetical protein
MLQERRGFCWALWIIAFLVAWFLKFSRAAPGGFVPLQPDILSLVTSDSHLRGAAAMVAGFNHNFRYKGEVYHVQTEDSGVKSPNIVTLLYLGGTILASKKTSYSDIARVDDLDQIVEELMKEQHKEMLRSLKAGEFDAVIERFQSAGKVAAQILPIDKVNTPLTGETPPAPKPAAPQPPVAPLVSAPVAPVASVSLSKSETQGVDKTPPPAAASEKRPSSNAGLSLDEVILSYLLGDDK